LVFNVHSAIWSPLPPYDEMPALITSRENKTVYG
jgi:hypothetical protein